MKFPPLPDVPIQSVPIGRAPTFDVGPVTYYRTRRIYTIDGRVDFVGVERRDTGLMLKNEPIDLFTLLNPNYPARRAVAFRLFFHDAGGLFGPVKLAFTRRDGSEIVHNYHSDLSPVSEVHGLVGDEQKATIVYATEYGHLNTYVGVQVWVEQIRPYRGTP